jgi:hypothetical protein
MSNDSTKPIPPEVRAHIDALYAANPDAPEEVREVMEAIMPVICDVVRETAEAAAEAAALVEREACASAAESHYANRDEDVLELGGRAIAALIRARGKR